MSQNKLGDMRRTRVPKALARAIQTPSYPYVQAEKWKFVSLGYLATFSRSSRIP